MTVDFFGIWLVGKIKDVLHVGLVGVLLGGSLSPAHAQRRLLTDPG